MSNICSLIEDGDAFILPPVFSFGLLWSKIRFYANQNSDNWLIYREKKRFSLAPYLPYKGRKPLDFFPAMQHSSLMLCFTGHLRHWFANGNFHNHDIQDSEVWVKQRVWCNTFDATCLNVDFLAYFGRNSRPLSFDIKIKWCQLYNYTVS